MQLAETFFGDVESAVVHAGEQRRYGGQEIDKQLRWSEGNEEHEEIEGTEEACRAIVKSFEKGEGTRNNDIGRRRQCPLQWKNPRPPSWNGEARGEGRCSPRTDHWRRTSKERRSSCILTGRKTLTSFPEDVSCTANRPKHWTPRYRDLLEWRWHSVAPHGAYSVGSLCESALHFGRGSVHKEYGVALGYLRGNSSAG